MSKIFRLYDPMMILADYKDPEPHKHLAAHFIVPQRYYKMEDNF